MLLTFVLIIFTSLPTSSFKLCDKLICNILPNSNANHLFLSQSLINPTINDINKFSLKEVFGYITETNKVEEHQLFPDVDVVKKSPTVCQFILANPKTFLSNDAIAAKHGLDLKQLDRNQNIAILAQILPLIYIADSHPEYGIIGYRLNKLSPKKMVDFYPSYRYFRSRPVYEGGEKNQGALFTMVHRKVGFPGNRAWKGVPSKPDFKLFYSPDIAMANELCSTNDAFPTDFKFFQWSTIWLPNQLEMEYESKLWITIDAPIQTLFTDNIDPKYPLYSRVVSSLPSSNQQLPSSMLAFPS